MDYIKINNGLYVGIISNIRLTPHHMEFGFSYVGLVYLIMLFVPNIIWSRYKPADYGEAGKENPVLLALERIGEVAVCCLVLIFSDFNLRSWSDWSWWLVISFLSMVLYEIYWIRYFMSERTMKDQYSSILGIPVAGATLPIIAFLLLSVYGRNPILAAAVVILGIGHIGIHLNHAKECR